jgi:predicted nucleic acid-binding Zn ribbon protein
VSRAAPRPLGLALTRLADELTPATTLARVQDLWERAVGHAVAVAAAPVAEREGVLTVSCASAAWAQELDMVAGELIARLNEALGRDAVQRLRCRVG